MRLLTITNTILIIVLASVAGGIVASAAPKSLSVTVVGADASDLRWRAVEEAAEFWNQQLTDAGVDARLGPITQLVQPVPDDAVRQLSESTLGGGLRPEIPEGLRQIPGDIVVTLSTADFISFGLREGPKALIGVRRADIPPLSLPNVPRNVVAHLLGLVLGLRHNSDPTTLMCGRPAPCRPSIFASERDQFFPLTAADRATLRARWQPAQETQEMSYSNPVYRWSVSYPGDWTIDSKDPKDVRISPPGHDGVCGLHSVAVRSKTVDEFSDVAQAYNDQVFRGKGTSTRSSPKQAITLPNGVAGIDVTTDILSGGKSRRIYVLADGVGYVIDCETYASNFDKLEPFFDRIIRSFSLKRGSSGLSVGTRVM